MRKELVVVTDNKEIKGIFDDMFKSEPLDLTLIDSVNKFKEILPKKKRCTLILDKNFQNLNCFEILSDIKRMNKNIETIIISEKCTAEDIIEAFNKGALAFLQYPNEVPLISEFIEEAYERIKIREELINSEKKYRSIFDNAPYGIVLTDNNGIIRDFNKEFLKMFKYNEKDLTSEWNISEIFPDISHVFEKNKILENYIGKNLDVIGYTKDHSERFVRIKINILDIEDDKIFQFFILDITDFRACEIEYKNIQNLYLKIDALIENAPVAFLILDTKGNILNSNKKAEEMLEYNLEELINLNIFHIIHPDFINILKQHYEDDIFDLSHPNSVDIKIITKDGNYLYTNIASNILRIEDNLIVISILTDITERIEFEKKKDKLLEKLQNAIEYKTKFLASVSHELRTPLNSIIGFSDLLLEESIGKLNDEQRDFLNDIHSSGQLLLNLINNLLDLTKIEAGKILIKKEKEDLDKIIDEVCSLVRPLVLEKNLEFILKYDYKGATIFTDEMRLKEILINLISNAIKYTEKGYVKLSVEKKKNYWLFAIEDSGIGIKKKDFPIIFREFGRVEDRKTHNIQGAGLGLALTKHLVKQLGGKIWFNSVYGKGSTFYFTHPIKK
ncbi:MAG: PAS domain S-box protein [Promethearchaeota archaeon]